MSANIAETETLQLTLTVPTVVAQYVRQQVSTGIYQNESEYIESLLLSDTLFEPLNENDIVHWMNTEGARRLEALHRDPSSGLTIEEAFAGLLDDEDEDEVD